MAAMATYMKITVATMIPHDRHHRNSPWEAITKLAVSTAFEEGEGGAKLTQQSTTRMVEEDEGWD